MMNNLFQEENETISQDLIDGIAEILNITFGVAKKGLNERNFKVETAIPKVVEGTEVHALINDARIGIVNLFELVKSSCRLQ